VPAATLPAAPAVVWTGVIAPELAVKLTATPATSWLLLFCTIAVMVTGAELLDAICGELANNVMFTVALLELEPLLEALLMLELELLLEDELLALQPDVVPPLVVEEPPLKLPQPSPLSPPQPASARVRMNRAMIDTSLRMFLLPESWLMS
jgi:hypothetical protein